MTTDTFTEYETGLTRLLEKLGKEHWRYIGALTLQSRLLNNITKAREYGDALQLQHDRAQIMNALNQLALAELGLSFNELCEEDAGQRKRLSTLTGCTAQIGSWIFKAKVVVITIVLLVIVVGLGGTVGRPMVEQWAAVWSLISPAAPAVTPSGPAITVKASDTIAISANARGATTYSWTLYGVGEISETKEGPVILYTASNKLGVAVLSVMARNDRGTSPLSSLILNVSCPTTANAEGTVSPAVAISSITFVVNGDEQVANDFGSPQVSSGDRVEVKEVTICVDLFKDTGGVVFVEFDPVDQGGKVIASEVRSTRVVAVAPDFTIIPGPDYTWTVGDNWQHISVVTVHYAPGGGTQNRHCEEGGCEVDDRVIVPIE
jgi:hypothetical protein